MKVYMKILQITVLGAWTLPHQKNRTDKSKTFYINT
jgi:hypothetical protein